LNNPALDLGPLLDEAADPILVLDPLAGRFVAANAAGCTLLGYTLEELLATPVSRVHPCELQRLEELVSEVLRSGRSSVTMLTCRTRSGDHLPAEMSLSTFEKHGRTYVLALVQDRSEHRARE